jgi:hypothetical protein
MFVLLTAVLLTGCAPAPAAPQPTPAVARGDWELLGARRVSFRAEKDVIGVTAREGLFTAIKLEVEGGTLEMYNVRITFGDGETFSPETRFVFREGTWSRTIDLPGKARVIRKIEFWYRSELKRGRATVRVYGKS